MKHPGFWITAWTIAGFAVAAPCGATMVTECPAGAATQASPARREVNSLLRKADSDARRVTFHASEIESFEFTPEMSWVTYADQLAQVRDEVNDLSNQLCQLETMRNAIPPSARMAIDKAAIDEHLLADNTEDAIRFLTAHQNQTWLPRYQTYLNNVGDEAHSLRNSLDKVVAYAQARREYRRLEHETAALGS